MDTQTGTSRMMTVTSTLMSGTDVLAEWEGNDAVASFFAPYAAAFECVGDSVFLSVTRAMVDEMIEQIEDFLHGLDFSRSTRWLDRLRNDDVVFTYCETLAI